MINFVVIFIEIGDRTDIVTLPRGVCGNGPCMGNGGEPLLKRLGVGSPRPKRMPQIGRASCRERV